MVLYGTQYCTFSPPQTVCSHSALTQWFTDGSKILRYQYCAAVLLDQLVNNNNLLSFLMFSTRCFHFLLQCSCQHVNAKKQTVPYFRPKGKSYVLFQTRNAWKWYTLGWHIPIWLMYESSSPRSSIITTQICSGSGIHVSLASNPYFITLSAAKKKLSGKRAIRATIW